MINNDIFIEGVSCTPLKQIGDERGMVMHHLNYLSPTFKGFEEVYISKTYPGQIKAWKLHLKMTQNFCVPSGEIRFVIYDNRADSETKNIVNQFILNDEDKYRLLTIPPNVWYGFECLTEKTGIIVNLSNLLFDPLEVKRADITDPAIPFNGWTNASL